MQNSIQKKAPDYLARNRRHRIWRKIVSALACIVVFCTTYALILPAITVGKELHCGKTEHVHTEDCYVKVGTGNQTAPSDAPDGTAPSESSDPSLPLEGTDPSLPPESTDPSLAPTEPDTYGEDTVPGTEPVHTHTDACYTLERGELTCTQPTEVPHTHTESCYLETSVLICELPETDGHTHESNCYDASGALTCGNEESEGHHHSPECYETKLELTCTLSVEPHQHTDECYAQNQVLTCTLSTEPAETEPQGTMSTEPAETETQEADVLTCTIPEGYGAHTHGEGCFDENGKQICQLKESEGHHHSTICYGLWELACKLEEHTHDLSCYSDPTADVETADDWEKTFADVGLIGKWSADVVAIAESQIGYKESEDNFTVEPDGKTINGYTRYGDWYGIPYGDWCAMFISFCLRYANVPAEAFPREASCPRWVEALQELEFYAPADGEYCPGVGDVVFFDHDADTLADHVGLVRRLRGETGFTTIEGNCNHSVAVQSYAVDDPTILGYGPLSVLSEVSPLSYASYGRNESDGSIWWGETINIAQITDPTTIQENVPYVIAGQYRRNVMTKSVQNDTTLITAQPLSDDGYLFHQIWYFEVNGDGYRIYFTDEQGSRTYLRLVDNALSLVTDVASASTFVASVAPEDVAGTGRLAFLSGSSYLNTVGQDGANCRGWSGWHELDAGSTLQLLQVTIGERQTAKRLETAVSPNAVINLFDYWTGAAKDIPDGDDHWDGGINENHNFKFYKDVANTYTPECGSMNVLQPQAVLNTGIVQRTLSNGYPALSGEPTITGGSTESLSYLFDPTVNSPGKESHHNVTGLLRINEEGYYYFNSRETMAEYIPDERYIAVYDKPGVMPNGAGDASDLGQFFPMNNAPQCMTLGSTNPVMNHYLGLTITTRFIQRYGGHSDVAMKKPTQFSFAGDDDVWIFIDNVLVADLGGAHASVRVTIDFSTGTITTTHANWSGPLTSTTTLLEQYQAAGAEGKTQWTTTEHAGENDTTYTTTTFADNTTHTLKFYYLERGNYDSNLELEYNLTEIPKTAIYKVDQLGNHVQGATFAVYAADQDYNMLESKSGSTADLSGEAGYDSAGNIIDASGNILAHALYKGTTNDRGEMIFMDQDEMPYTLSELEDMFGLHFILRETEAPPGYRVVAQDTHLEIWHGENQTLLQCKNSKESGTRAAPTLQVTATDTLCLRGPNQSWTSVEYCKPDGTVNGTLFAVIFKYVGNIDENGNATDFGSDSSWVPVYGNDLLGYHLVDMTDKSFLAGALEAAQKGQDYGDVTFNLSSNSTMQLTMRNLPGDITTYYRLLSNEQKGQTRYTVSYYWTPSTLAETTLDTIHRVYTFGEITGDEASFSAFDRVFGADIQVPNLNNIALVQKVDEDDQLINGATFAIYPVEQQSDGSFHYKTGNDDYVALSDSAKFGADGTITDGDTTIAALDTVVTSSWSDGIHHGTAAFTNLPQGQYLIREVKAPTGYLLNPHDIMVLVTDDTIYANAGTETDGISVGRGPGYVLNSLEYLASVGHINSTLTWIYGQVKLYPTSGITDTADTARTTGRFTDVTNPSVTPGYLTESFSGKTSASEADAARSYLIYEYKENVTAFNYAPNTDRETIPAGLQNPTGTRRLFATTGWPYYEIYQDYEYGKQVKGSSAIYEDWSDIPVTHLFSRSTYIRVKDEQATQLQVKKVSAASHETMLFGAQFRLYRQDEGQAPEYYCRTGDEVSWNTNPASALVVSTNADGLSSQRFTRLTNGTYYLEEIVAPAGYVLPPGPVKLELNQTVMTLPDLTEASGNSIAGEPEEGTNLYLYTVTVPNNTGYVLPETGGSGVLPYTMGGLLAICLSVPLLLVQRKRKKQNVTPF